MASLAVCVVTATGCGDDGSTPGDAGGGGDSGMVCSGVDTTCPAAIPSQGAACEGTLSCDFLEPGNDNQWRYDCVDGGWVATNTFCGHDGICIPPLVQTCSTPFSGMLPGATLTIGTSSGRFQPFAPDDVVPLVWGPQGGAMLPVRLEVAGDSPPACIQLDLTPTLDGTAAPTFTQRVALWCGLSQPVFVILGVECGGMPEHTVSLHASMEGVGEADTAVTVSGGDEPCTF